MADKKISEMTGMIASEIANDDDIVISDTSASHTKRAPISELATFFGVNTEGIQDTVGTMFSGGTHSGVNPVYDDPNGVINFTLAGSVTDAEMGHLHGVTSDIQTQIDTKSPIASPTFTGTPSAPNPSANTNTTQLATTQYVQGELGAYASDNVTFTNKAGVISQWTNDSNYMTAGSTNTLTNKSGSNSQWTNDEAYIKASTSDTLTNKAISGSGNTITNIPYSAVSGIVDTDLTSVSGSDDQIASSKSIKTYVDAQISGIDSLAEANDSNISSPSSGQILVWDGTDSFDNQTSSVSLTGIVTGTANMDASGDVSIATTIPNNTITVNGTAIALGGSGTISSVLQSGGTFTGDVHVQDNVKFSAGNTSGTGDLQIYHDTTDSIIKNGTGELKVLGDTVKIKNNADNSTLASFTNAGASELYHNGTKKLETTSGGTTVSGTLTATALAGTLTSSQVTTALGFTPYNQTNPDGYITTDTTIGGSTGADFNDNVKLRFGDASSPDLEIYHDGSHSYIRDVGTGDLMIRGTEVRIKSNTDNDDMATFIENGASNLFYSNAKKLETVSGGVTVTGTLTATTLSGAISGNISQLTNNSGYVTSSGVTSVATGNGLSGGTITSTGTLTMSGSYSGSFSATGNITAYSSDERLKNFKGKIENALDKVQKLNGYYYEWNDVAKGIDPEAFKDGVEVGVNAQEVEEVMPEVVAEAPIVDIHKLDTDYKTVHYDKLVPLLIESIKELKAEIEELKKDK